MVAFRQSFPLRDGTLRADVVTALATWQAPWIVVLAATNGGTDIAGLPKSLTGL